MVQREPFATPLSIAPFNHLDASQPRFGRGAVAAVVGYHQDPRGALSGSLQCRKRVPNQGFFVMRGDNDHHVRSCSGWKW